jgi:putative integral membrane protein (TIGR02587 family)
MTLTRFRHRRHAWKHEWHDLIRGACGGFLFGIPLLYTMEVWWIGSIATPPVMMMALVTGFVIALLLNRTAGFRKTKDIRLLDAVMDSVEALAIGLVCSGLMLVLLREITLQVPLHEVLGKVLFEGVPFTIGVALAAQILRGSRTDDTNSDDAPQARSHADEMNATIADVGATLIGALIIAFNIAPTDEVTVLAAAVSGGWLLAVMLASLLISYLIVFEADFSDQRKRMQQRGIFQRPLSETIACYLVSLIASAFMLFFFQRLNFQDPWTMWLHYSILLGLPATVGGAAGRLAV